MSGKNKTSAQKGKTTVRANVLTSSMATKPEEVLSISALQAELQKTCAAISSEMQASLSPINQSLDALRKKLDDYEPRQTERDGYCQTDRAHRTLRAKLSEGERPRPIIIHFFRFQQRERVLSIARKKGQLTYQGHRIFIFPDLSNALAKKRATFNPVKVKLYQRGIKFSLRHPAVFCFTYQQRENHSAEDTETFLNQHIEGH